MDKLIQDDFGNIYYAGAINLPLAANVRGGLVPSIQSIGTGNVTNLSSVNNTATGLLELAALHNTLLVGNNLIASGTSDDKKKQDPTYIVNRPWIEAPDGSIPFDTQTAVDLPAIGSVATVVVVVVPDGYDGVINAYSANFSGGGFLPQGSGDIVWQVLRDGVPIKNYDNITVEKGTIQNARNISPLRVYSKQTISLVVNHVANVALNGKSVGSFVGYFYPSAS